MRILNNSVNGTGGALYGIDILLLLRSTLFSWNMARLDGGGISLMYLTNSENQLLTFENNLFENNTASFGGGIYIHYSGDSTDDMLSFENNTFRNNTASYGEGGGGIYAILRIRLVIC